MYIFFSKADDKTVYAAFLDGHTITSSSGGTMLQQLLLVTLGLVIVVLPLAVDSRQKVLRTAI